MNRRLKIFSERLFIPTHVAVSYIVYALSSLWELEIYAEEAMDSELVPNIRTVPLTKDLDIERLVCHSDVVHCYAGSKAFQIAKAIRESSVINGVPYTISIGGTWLYEWIEKGSKYDLIQNVISDAYRVIVPTYSQKNIMQSYGLFGNKIVVVRPGLPLERYKPIKIHDKPNKFIVCFVGRLVSRKNVTGALDAFRIVHSSYLDSHFIIIGDGPDKDSLVQAIRKAGLEESCVLLGKLPHNKMLDVLRGASVLCYPTLVDDRSLTSGVPFVVLESQAVGVPVVAAGVGGIVEGIVDGKTGFLSDTSIAEEIAEYLLRLANDRSMLSEMSLAAHEWIQNQFALKRSVRSINEIFKSATEIRGVN